MQDITREAAELREMAEKMVSMNSTEESGPSYL